MHLFFTISLTIGLYLLCGVMVKLSFRRDWIKEASRVGAVTHYRKKAFIGSLFWPGLIGLCLAVMLTATILKGLLHG